jgi:hypothetical protein
MASKRMPWDRVRASDPVRVKFEDAVAKVREGSMTFDELARDARAHFERLAKMVEGWWKQPAWVDLDDVLQDLLEGASEAVWKYEDGRSSLRGYVTFGAVDRAKKRAHRARLGRRPHRGEDSAPARFEVGFSRVWGEDADRRAEEALSAPGDQERELERVERLAQVLAACVDEQERRVMRAVAEAQDLVAGAERIFTNPVERAACGLGDDARGAVRAVVGVVERVAGRLAADDPEVGEALRAWGA